MEDFTRNTRLFFSTPKRRASISLTYINIELTETPPATGFTQNTTPLSCAQRIRAPKTRIGKCQNKTTPKEVAGMFYAEPLAPLRSLKLLPFHLHQTQRPAALYKPCSLPALSSCFHTTVSSVLLPLAPLSSPLEKNTIEKRQKKTFTFFYEKKLHLPCRIFDAIRSMLKIPLMHEHQLLCKASKFTLETPLYSHKKVQHGRFG